LKVTYDNTNTDNDLHQSQQNLHPNTNQEVESSFDSNLKPLFNNEFTCLEGFSNPVLFLATFDDVINKHIETLHPWQVEEGEKLGRAKPTSKHPFKYALCAANGSGKDAYVIAPFAVWFICCKIRSLVVITSSSSTQLQNQTEKYIASLCNKVNKWSLANLGQEILKVRQRHITCLLSGSEIFLFATDEEGKAEGYHPSEPNAEFAIIVNEAKSVPPGIFRALKRCTGFNYWLNISTPGEPLGDFFNSFENWPNKRRVTYYDCPHQSPDEFEEDRRLLGEHDPLFRSKWLALFTFVGGKTVVSQIALERLRRKIKNNSVKWINKDSPLKIGLDVALSKNGDETVITCFKGNKQLKRAELRIQDATVLADNIERIWIDWGVKKDHPYIWADDGGVGRAVIDILRRKKWIGIKRVLNQSPAKRKKEYRNRGAELWHKFAKLVEFGCIILLDDDKTYSQINSRKFKKSEAGVDKLTLQSKMEMISEGLPSPDRADALVLALLDTNVNDFADKIETTNNDENVSLTREQHIQKVYNDLKNFRPDKQTRSKDKAKRNRGLSLNVLVGSKSRHNKLTKYK
jgi:phage terminase large subunit